MRCHLLSVTEGGHGAEEMDGASGALIGVSLLLGAVVLVLLLRRKTPSGKEPRPAEKEAHKPADGEGSAVGGASTFLGGLWAGLRPDLRVPSAEWAQGLSWKSLERTLILSLFLSYLFLVT